MKKARNRGCWQWLPWVVIALLLVPCVLAQETTAGIQGTVKDPSGAIIAGATVEVYGPALIGTRKVQTDAGGDYRIVALPPGTYTMSVSASGFRTYKQEGIDLTVGRLPTMDVTLPVGAVAETVEVTSAAPIVDTTQSKVAVTVQREVLDSIPKGRSFQSLIPFAPGARQEPLQGSRTNRDNGYQIDGASDSENVYLVDGVNTTDIQNGGVGKNFQTEFIEEVQIKSSSFEAEYGGALGGVINAVAKHGSNDWHGELLMYLRTNALNANDPCASGYTSGYVGSLTGNASSTGINCGQRLNPSFAGLNQSQRLDGVPEYYAPRKDQRRIIEPGFDVGGPLFKNKLWLFSSYIPQLDAIHRTTTFTGNNPGPRTLTSSFIQHNMYNRLDYGVFNSLRLFASWNYGYSRTQGQLGNPDSVNPKQVNTGASTDPNTLRSDRGSVNPLAVYSFGGDWTPTARLVVSARYGYFFANNEERGIPTGTRYTYQANVNAQTKDLAGNGFPTSLFNTAGFANIPSNLAYVFDAYKRHGFNVDASYFVSKFAGTHTFKGGFFYQTQSNAVLRNFNGGAVDLYWGQSYTPQTNTAACDQIMAANKSAYGQSICQGLYGYFVVGTNVTNTGTDRQTAHALYIQDAWNVGHGLTLNLGVRFDQETQPPYNPKLFPTVDFGWGDKVAPRLGAAYDLLHNGKIKVYGSYGKFYDIMKMGLARGSFGSDYWHDCVYALDSADFKGTIQPSYPLGGGCPASGPAPGVSARFIENVDFRATKADPRDPAISPTMKPMEQHEYTFGVDWAITPNWGLETRYSRKRLDRTIEDMAITDDLGFYIGNPGSHFADLLHRPTVIPNDNGDNYYNTVPFCAECPPVVGAIRRYDGVEFRLAKRATGNWFGAISYTYSRLQGNYAGLTNTDPTDGNGGRHSPNNHRAFDIPTMTYLPSGGIDDGPLSTDRPHTAKLYGSYRLKWAGMNTTFGFTEFAFQGTPIDTCLPVVGTSSACQWAEGRGNAVQFHRASDGTIVKDSVVNDARTPPYIQSDISVHHEFRVSKEHENRRMGFEWNISNLFNQHAPTGYYEFAIPANDISPSRAARFSGDPQVDWAKVMKGYNYMDALNGLNGFTAKMTLASRYGLPVLFQTPRNMRVAIRYTF